MVLFLLNRAKTNCDVFVLHKQDLDLALEYYPDIKKQIMNIAEERRNQARQRSAAKVTKIDDVSNEHFQYEPPTVANERDLLHT